MRYRSECLSFVVFFFSSRRRHTRYWRDWSSDVCSSDLEVYDDGGLFGVRLAFFRHTAADVRLRILEGRRRTVEQQREGLRASLARTRQRFDRYTLELQRHGLESVDREVRWLSELIDAELTDTERREATTTESTSSEK